MFTRSWLVRLPSGSPLHGVVLLKLSTTRQMRWRMSTSEMRCLSISKRISWSTEAKNFLMSHFNTQSVFVLLRFALATYLLSAFMARCVPLYLRHEYEWEINVLSKNG